MQQAWHIFKKDIRCLRLEILNYLGAILVGGWLAAFSISVAEVLVAFTAAYLIAGLIHADAPAGDRQFWITRPYRWQSLLGAKLLFILLVVDIPVLLAQWILLVHYAFSFSSIWLGLLWEQFLLFFGAFVPLAALAALTRGVVPFVSFALIAVLMDIGISLLAQMPELSLRSIGWIRSTLYFALLLAASAIVMCIQYKMRYTSRSRLIAFCILIPGVIAYAFVPWSLAFAIQQRFSTQPVNPSSLGVALNSSSPHWGLAPIRGKRVQVSLPLELKGLPPDTAANPEALEGTVRSADGRNSRMKFSNLSIARNVADQSSNLILTGNSELDRSFFDAARDRPVTLRGSLYLTVFGNKRSHTVSLHEPDRQIEVTDQLRCFIGQYGVICNSPFRWPDQWISVAGASSAISLYYPMSHSPFPANLRFYPFDSRWSPPPGSSNTPRRKPASELTIEIADPVAYLRRDFEIREVHLTDIAVPWHSQRVLRDGKTIFENEY